MENINVLFKTNVNGLDDLLHGGIRIPSELRDQKKGLVILIKGAPGSGKTTLTCQLVCSLLLDSQSRKVIKHETLNANDQEAINEIRENSLVHYYSMDQTEREILKKIFKLIFNSEVFNSSLKARNQHDLSFEQIFYLLQLKNRINNLCECFKAIPDQEGSKNDEFFNLNKVLKLWYKKICDHSHNSTDSELFDKIINDQIISIFEGNKYPTVIRKYFLKQLQEANDTFNNQMIDTIKDDIQKLIDDYKNHDENKIFKSRLIEIQSNIIILKELKYQILEIAKFKEELTVEYFKSLLSDLLMERPNNQNCNDEILFFKDFFDLISAVSERILKKDSADLTVSRNQGDIASAEVDQKENKVAIIALKNLNVFSSQTMSSQSTGFKPVGLPLSSALSLLNSIPEKEENPFLTIIDGLNSLTSEETNYFNFQTLVKSLRKKSVVSIVVYDPVSEGSDFIDYMSDMIIDLRVVKSKDPIKYDNFSISIPKSRYQNAIRGSQHQYKIRKYGLVVFPYLHYYSTTERTGTGELTNPHLDVALERSIKSMNDNALSHAKVNTVKQSSLIDKVLNGIFPGSVTVLIGPRHTSKTSLSMDFLKSKLNVKEVLESESRLLVSIIDNAQTIINERDCKRKSCKHYSNNSGQDNQCYEIIKGDKSEKIKAIKPKCYDNIHLYHFQPLVITGNELMFQLDRRIRYSAEQHQPITRFAFFDLTQLEYRFPNIVQDPYFLPSFMDYLKSSRYIIDIDLEKSSVTRKYNTKELSNFTVSVKQKNEQEVNDNTIKFILLQGDKEIEIEIFQNSNQRKESYINVKYKDKFVDNSRLAINEEQLRDLFDQRKPQLNQSSDINEKSDQSVLFRVPFDSGFIKVEKDIHKNLHLIIEYRISSLFMVSGAANLTKPISVMADNVIFLWRDKLKKSTSNDFLCIYIDRTEGDIKVNSKRFWAFSINDDSKDNPLSDPQRNLPKSAYEPDRFVNAEHEIKKIISLQGVTRSLYDYDQSDFRY